MATDDIAARVAAFFDSYVRAFERYDAAGIADLFAYPAHVTGDADPITPTTVPDRAGWEARLTELLGAYRALSVTTASILRSSTTEPLAPARGGRRGVVARGRERRADLHVRRHLHARRGGRPAEDRRDRPQRDTTPARRDRPAAGGG